jgi:agmatine deiminase
MLPPEIEVLRIDSDDAWARDTAPTFVKNSISVVRGINWCFNAWGGEVDGLYATWGKDDALAKEFCRQTGYDIYDASPFVLEGGSIHTDGEGTLLTTEACLLSPGRNPQLNREGIEEKLRDYLGIKKIIWLPHGIWRDETNEHVDNICAFIRPGEVVLAWTDDKTDPQYEYSKSCLDVLERETDVRGRPIKVHKLPIPVHPVCVSEADLPGYIFEEGEDRREAGERLAASYVNFYFSNGAVLLPQFGGENAESDRLAMEIMSRLCPERELIPVPARAILLGGGNIHCITQQIPKGGKKA